MDDNIRTRQRKAVSTLWRRQIKVCGCHCLKSTFVLRTQCFKSAWIYAVLHNGFGMSTTKNRFKSTLEIDGQEVQWTLGALLHRMRYFPLRYLFVNLWFVIYCSDIERERLLAERRRAQVQYGNNSWQLSHNSFLSWAVPIVCITLVC